jgi:hypothetical protein
VKLALAPIRSRVPGTALPWQRAAVHRAILTPMESQDELFIREVLEAWNRGDWDAVLER